MICLLTFALLTLHVQAYVKSVNYCKGASAVTEKSEDRVTGQIKIIAGHTIPFKVTIVVSEDIPSGGELAIKIRKKIGWVWSPLVPCVNNIGSCTYPINCNIKLLGMELLGEPCEIKKGVYHIDHAIHIPANFSVPTFLTLGEYAINAEARKADKVYGCVDIVTIVE